MVNKILTFLTAGLLASCIIGCAASGNANIASDAESLLETSGPGLDSEQTVMCSLRVTAGESVLDGVLYDNPTARGFAEMLPLTVDLWHPAPDFARAFDLPGEIAQKGSPGYGYELGSLAYWDSGPSIAPIYKASREETVVPVVPIGKIISDVSVFEEYGGSITVEIAEDTADTGAVPDSGGSGAAEGSQTAEGGETVFTADTNVWDVINDPVFGDYGRLIFPADKSISDRLTLG